MRPRLVLALLLAFASPTIADEYSDRLKSLEAAANRKVEGQSSNADAAQFVRLMRQLGGMSEDRIDDLRRTIEISELLPPLRKEMLSLIDDAPGLLRKRLEEQQKQIAETLKKAQERAQAATDPAVLDVIVRETEASQRSLWWTDLYKESGVRTRLSDAMDALSIWKAYLSNRKAGYADIARSNLRNLLDKAVEYPFFDAVQVKSAMAVIDGELNAPQAEVLEILRSVKTPSDISGAVTRLEKISASVRDQDDLQATLRQLRTLATQYAENRYGFVGDSHGISGGVQPSSPSKPELLRIEGLVEMDTLTRAFAELGLSGPKPNETTVAYTFRMANAAAKEKKWDLVIRILSGSTRSANRSASNSSGGSIEKAIKAYIVGQRLEAAGQYASAIQSYRRVLAVSGDLAPIEEATERLKKLSAEHKDAVAQVDRDEEIRDIVKSVLEAMPQPR